MGATIFFKGFLRVGRVKSRSNRDFQTRQNGRKRRRRRRRGRRSGAIQLRHGHNLEKKWSSIVSEKEGEREKRNSNSPLPIRGPN